MVVTATSSTGRGGVFSWRPEWLGLLLGRGWFSAIWMVAGAFGTYAAMYGFRKPFTAGTYEGTEYGEGLKAWLVIAQVLGYMLSKFIGIRVIAEMTAARRVGVLLFLIGLAEVALCLFAVTPPPYGAVWLFFNGLALGMVFGLVLGFLEGRRLTEFFVAGLCASFILADGLAKSVGAALLSAGVSEFWMPAAAGGIFLGPLVVGAWMLSQVPVPSGLDVEARSERVPMGREDRVGLLVRHGARLGGILLAYLLITVLRSFRADFAPEIWRGLGVEGQPGIFARSELWVALAVVAANGALVWVRDNRRAFFLSLWLCAAGLGVVVIVLLMRRAGWLPPFGFMVLLGVGMYLPYVAVHTTVFERLLALTRERGNMAYLMYLADAAGYLGYVVVMLGKGFWMSRGDLLQFFLNISLVIAVLALASVLVSWFLYARRMPDIRGSG